ncbi:MAG: hypothetical protein HY909_13835 [Deltaproteobacteria bacterium]|nr:hypothetical protein [Deltaproteobacteria bacterium]
MDIKKIIARLPTGFVDDASGMNGDRLRAEIIRAETALREVEQLTKADTKLQGAKEIVKDIVGSYNDARRAQRAKIAYVLHVLEERGELGVGEATADTDAVTRESRPAPAKAGAEPKGRTRAA